MTINPQMSRSDALVEGRRLQAAGRLAEAEAIYRSLLKRDERDAEALHLLGAAAHQAGRDLEAAELIGEAVAIDPGMAVAWQNLVLPLLALGRHEGAVRAGRKAVKAAPDRLGGRANLVLALIRANRYAEAALEAEAAIARHPGDPLPWSQLGHIRMQEGEATLSEALYARALTMAPDDIDLVYNHAVALQGMRREREAAERYARVLARDPAHKGARLNLGVALRSLGRLAEAIDVWSKSVDRPEDWPELAYDIAGARLLGGDWRAAWPDYELRLEVQNSIPDPPRTDRPLWRGEHLRDGTLLVHHEQGLGDTIQFMRFVEDVAARCGRVALVCQRPLRGLLASHPLFRARKGAEPAALLVRHGDPLPEHAAWTPLLSLAGILKLDRNAMPRSGPYLSAERARIAAWAARLDKIDGGGPRRPFRVGLVWQGNPKAPVERGRSIPLEAFAPIAAIPGVTFVSLQKGFGREQEPPRGMALNDLGEDFDAGPDAFLDSAAVLANIDLLVTTDTSMAHVAGALGRPTWLLLKSVPDWRWGLAGELTPWYPTLRLFRQPEPEDWGSVLVRVAAELGLLVEARAGEPSADPLRDRERAIGLHAAGRHAEALPIYRSLIAALPNDAQLLNLYGMAAFDAGRRSREAALAALPHVYRSVALAPGSADFSANLAVLLRAVGAAADAREALARALSVQPEHRAARGNLINLEVASGDMDAACRVAEEVVQRFSADGPALASAAHAFKTAKRYGEAAAALRRAIDLEPTEPRHRIALGAVHMEAGERPAAVQAWLSALVLDPNQPDALSNLGVDERNHGESGLAIWLYRRAVTLDPAHADAWCNLGIADSDRGDAAAAEHAFRRAIASRASHPDARMALGMTLLGQGRYEEGLPDYELRLRSERLGLEHQMSLPAWDGEDPRGKSFLITAEQGFGDALQFVRYAAVLKKMGAARVLVGCRTRLKAILGSATGVDGVVGEGETVPRLDRRVHMMSLPYRTGTRLDAIPADVPYLSVDPERVERWAAHLAAGDGFRVGLVWQGNPDPGVDKGRSLPLAALEPLARIPGVRLIALQKGPGSEQVEAVAGRMRVETLADFDEGPQSFLDSAAVMMNLDLVVTTDTAVAHLAGALGRPFWVLLKAMPEWRWLSRRADSPWYPTARLFRQPAGTQDGPGAWTAVVATLAGELARLVAGDRSRLVDFTPDTSEAPIPDEPAVAFQKALAAHIAGRRAEARRGYAEVLAREPDHAEAVHMVGALALEDQDWPRALFFLREAGRLGLASPEYRTNLAVAWRNLDRPAEAERLVRGVIAEKPSSEAYLTLGNILRDGDRTEEAAQAMSAAVRLGPGSGKALRGYGNALKDCGRLDEALAVLNKAVKFHPDDPELMLDRAHARLMAGDFAGGFADYEWRWRSRELTERNLGKPAWDGKPLDGRTLLIHGEQGLGDHIQFFRYLADPRLKGGSVILEIRRPLFGLARALTGVEGLTLVEQGGPLPPFDLQLPLLSLPHALKPEPRTLPKSVPYLAADPERVARWRERLDGEAGILKVGLVWQGNPQARADRGRSPPLSALKPLFEVPGLRIVSLQKEHGLDQLDHVGFADRIERPGEGFDDGPDAFLDTAAAMTALDLVVTSDTAAAHLAGALGRPAFVMLKHVPDWRWMLGRVDSPWYPTLRLFRQRARGDWGSVATAVAAALRPNKVGRR
jgi:tetratricopeptide (TPR) repeat protein/ADP-heptose:LPS heptosyltransferase